MAPGRQHKLHDPLLPMGSLCVCVCAYMRACMLVCVYLSIYLSMFVPCEQNFKW